MSDIGYQVILSNGTVLGGGNYEITDISQQTSNTNIIDNSVTSIGLVRRGARNYSEVNAENLVHMLENFSDSTPPVNPLVGQVWFNPASVAGYSGAPQGQLFVYDANEAWVLAGNPKTTGLQNPISLAFTGDATGSATTDLSTNVSVGLTLAASGVAPGTYAYPTLTINAKGLVTSATASVFGPSTITNALGYTPARATGGTVYDAVNKIGDTMSGSLTLSAGNVNTATGYIMQGGNVLIPRGIITMWSGSSSAVPAGWALCNGGNGTPNLTGRFMVCTGNDPGGFPAYTDGATGGNSAIGIAGQSISIPSVGVNINPFSVSFSGAQTDGYALQVGDLPPHAHPYGTSQNVHNGTGTSYASGGDQQVWDNVSGATTGNTGGGNAHVHTLSGLNSGSISPTGSTNASSTTSPSISFDNRPLFYAIAYIMKL